MQLREILIYLSVIYKGDWDQIFEVISKKKLYYDKAEVERVCARLGCHAVTIMDAEYPEELKQIFKPPFVLFYFGDISLIKNIRKNLAIVGSRDAKADVLSYLKEIVYELKPEITIVSGMAVGVDGMAHRAAIESNHRTIAVLGSGLDFCYPSENQDLYDEIKSKHLLISEYPIGVPPSQDKFPKRNRIVMGLSHGIFVPTAARKSGSMITVALGWEENKDIMCLPSADYEHSGCNLCIKNGAYLVENADDINYFF